MLSFIISNAILATQALTGMTPGALENTGTSDYLSSDNVQTITVTSESPQNAHRDDFVITDAPRLQLASNRPQTVTQSHLGANSAVAASALKYNGYSGWDCTMLVEQALRDMGYSVGDIGTMSFSPYGSTFSDPGAVQAGDIMMRWSHVAIYLGDGMAIHGGYNGRVVIVPTSPTEFASFVRVG